MEILGFIITIFSLLFGFYQFYCANKSEKKLQEVLNNQPQKILEGVSRLISPLFEETKNKLGDFGVEGYYEIDVKDLDGDGKQELLIQYPYGAHGSMLKVFGRRNYDFEEIGELSSGTPCGFKIADFDLDGHLEIKTIESSENYPYALVLRDSVFYRWDGNQFLEISRTKEYTEEDVKRRMKGLP